MAHGWQEVAGSPAPNPRVIHLTRRERDVIGLVLQSRSGAEIARILGLRTNSVESYLSRLYARVGVRGRLELALRAEREGWLSTG